MNEQTATSFDRRAERTHLFLVATLYVRPDGSPVRVRNLSSSGALIEGSELPPVGSAIVLRRGQLEAVAAVVWADRGRAGLCFSTAVTVAAWLPTKEAARQAQVDQIAFGMKHAERALTAVQSALAEPFVLSASAAIADLVRLRAELDYLGETLAQDEAVVVSHPEIQWFDAAGQRIGKIVEALKHAHG